MATFAAAHRGLSAEKVENTTAAFEAAAAAGFAAVEMDLRATADGEVVVLHDASLERTASLRGRIETLSWADVKEARTKDGPVPRLADLYGKLAEWQGLWNLEVKARAALAGTLQVAERLGRRALVSSMDPHVLLEARRQKPSVARASIPLGPVDDGDLELAREAGCHWINVDIDFLDADLVARLREAGLRVGTWTVNDLERAREAASWGVACIITDRRDVGALFPHRPEAW